MMTSLSQTMIAMMTKTTETPLDSKRQKLLKTKLGKLLFWTKPQVSLTVGPYDPDVFNRYAEDRHRLIGECEEKLRSCSDGEIDALINESPDRPVRSEWRGFLDREISELRNNKPPWYAAGMGNLEYRADFEYWSKMPRFSVNELLCLSLGVRPDAFKSSEFRKILTEDPTNFWPSLKFMRLQYELLRRTFDPDSFGGNVRPRRFLSWAGGMEFEAHPEFIDNLQKFHGEDTEGRASVTNKPDKREIDKIAQLFTAMAIDNLGYDPKATRSPTPREIADLAATMGLSISADTIRKYLAIGATFIPEGWEPE